MHRWIMLLCLQSLDKEEVDIIGSTILGIMERFATDIFTDDGNTTIGNISKYFKHA